MARTAFLIDNVRLITETLKPAKLLLIDANMFHFAFTLNASSP